MDKLNSALIEIEELRTRQDGIERKTIPLIVAGEKTSGGVSFGVLEGRNAAVIVTFTGSGELVFNGDTAMSGLSPLFAVVSGKGELMLSGSVSAAHALVIGAKLIKA